MILVGVVGVQELFVFYGRDDRTADELAVGSYKLLILCEYAKDPRNAV